MLEMLEFRVPEIYADQHLPHDAGVRAGLARKFEVSRSDSLFSEIGRLDEQFRREGKAFFTAWIPHRRYTRAELRSGALVHAIPNKLFEPAGEECGTVYDESTACEICGGGASQVGPLVMSKARIRRTVDFAQTIAGEIVVSARARDAFLDAGLGGVDFAPILYSAGDEAPASEHYQLLTVGPTAEITPRTRAGADSFDDESRGRCPRGHVIGLNLLSEIEVTSDVENQVDVMATRQMVGDRTGLLRPRPRLLFSAAALRVTENAKLTGLRFEVAHVA